MRNVISAIAKGTKMNRLFINVIGILALLSTSALGSISDKEAKEADMKREGTIPTLVKAYYVAHVDKLPNSCGSDFNQEAAAPDYLALRLQGSSGYDQNTLSYTSTYLVVKYCFHGATHGGSDRDIVESIVIQATRKGTASPDGGIKATVPDKFKVLRSIDTSLFAAQYGQQREIKK
jgi:hypothetical protein